MSKSAPGSAPGHALRSRFAALPTVLILAATTACGGGPAEAPAGGAAGGRGAMAAPVEILTLAEKPVEQTSEFVGTVEVAAVQHGAVAGGGLPPEDQREIRRPRGAGHGAVRDRRDVAAGGRRQPGIDAGRARSRRRRSRASRPNVRKTAPRGRRDEPAGARPGAGAAADGRSAAEGRRRADQAAEERVVATPA